MSVTIERKPPRPAPLPEIERVMVSNYGHSSPWNLEINAFDKGLDPLVQIRDDRADNHLAIYLTPEQARQLGDAFHDLADLVDPTHQP